MAKADVMAGRAYVSLYAKNDVSKTLTKLKTELNDIGSSMMTVGAQITGFGLGLAGSLAAAVMHFADVGSELNDMSARTGISTTALAEFGHAAQMTGTEMSVFEGGVAKMQKTLGGIGPESQRAKEALQAMGLSVTQIAGMAPEDQFQMIAESIGAIEDPSQKAAAAMAIFGKSGTDLLPMMENIRDLRKEAQDLGLAPSPESIAAADEIGDAIDRVRAVVSATFFEIGAALAPMAAEVLSGFLTIVRAVRRFASENKALLITAAKIGAVLIAVGSTLMVAGSAFIVAGMAISGVLATMSAFGAAAGLAASVLGSVVSILIAAVSPVGLLVAALVAGAYAWARFTESGKTFVGLVTSTFSGMLTTVKDTFGGIVDAIKAGDLKLAGQIALVGLKLVFAQGMEAIYKLFGDGIGTMASKLLKGDFAGAWSTLGKSILDSVATITQGITGLFTGAADAVAEKWAETVNAISDFILESASQGGLMGWALEQVSGVNMQEELARSQKLEAERRAKGMNPDDAGLLTSDKFNITDETRAKINELAAEIDANMAAMTAATGDSLNEDTDGQAAAVTENIAALQAELAALKAEAAGKVSEINSGKAGGGAAGDKYGGAFGDSGTRGSAGTFSLAELASNAGQGVAQKQLSVAQEQKKLAEKALAVNQQQLMAMAGMMLVHA